MQISMYDTLVPTADRMLGSLSAILDKAAVFAKNRNFDPSNLLNARLAPDMFALTRQVQIATDMVTRGAARLSGGEVQSTQDDETTIDELQARIAKAREAVNAIPAEKFAGAEDRQITITTRRGELSFNGLGYLRDFVLPNLYFHVTTTYAILRHNGVELGKVDFLGA